MSRLEEHKKILEELIAFEKPDQLEAILRRLAKFGYDEEDIAQLLSGRQIARILERYLQSELSAQAVEDWANAVEMCEDIELGNQNDAVTLNAIWELANPLITQPLTPAVAKRLIDSFIGALDPF